MNKYIVLLIVSILWGNVIFPALGLPVWVGVLLALMIGWYWNQIWRFLGGK